jgi:hypothetical protein
MPATQNAALGNSAATAMLPLGAAAPPLLPPPAVIVASRGAYAAAPTALTPNVPLSVNNAG